MYDLVDGKKVARRVPTKPSTINRDLRTLRAALKKARPDYRFPGGAFFKGDETRVRWLRPEEELLVLEAMPSPFREMAKLAALDLRHHGATMGLNRGFTAPTVMALGGWKTERMMRRYAAVTDATLRAAAEAVSGSEGTRTWIRPSASADRTHG